MRSWLPIQRLPSKKVAKSVDANNHFDCAPYVQNQVAAIMLQLSTQASSMQCTTMQPIDQHGNVHMHARTMLPALLKRMPCAMLELMHT